MERQAAATDFPATETSRAKTYIGRIHAATGWTVTVEQYGEEEPLHHYVRHSPDGFSWGYGGSGPAELARSILLDYLGPRATCEWCHGTGWWEGRRTEGTCPECNGDGVYVSAKTYQAFKWEVIAQLDQAEGFRITEAAIRVWLAKEATR